ncbi:MAG: hypothetical protein Q8K32_30265 [Archangium sp.]|nr:hypothetical protein [Archangium sp.]
MTNTSKQTNWKRSLGAAIAMAAVGLVASGGTAALAADVPHRSQMDAGINLDVMDAGVIELDAGAELQGSLRGELLRGKNVPQ